MDILLNVLLNCLCALTRPGVRMDISLRVIEPPW